jgi:hypothetical protein
MALTKEKSSWKKNKTKKKSDDSEFVFSYWMVLNDNAELDCFQLLRVSVMRIQCCEMYWHQIQKWIDEYTNEGKEDWQVGLSVCTAYNNSTYWFDALKVLSLYKEKQAEGLEEDTSEREEGKCAVTQVPICSIDFMINMETEAYCSQNVKDNLWTLPCQNPQVNIMNHQHQWRFLPVRWKNCQRIY